MSKLNAEEIIYRLKALQSGTDVECSHCEADDILCELLIDIGYSDVVEEYNEVDKWYA